MPSKIQDNNYFQISGWMLNRLKLKGTDLQIYAIIYGFSQDCESEFTGSLQYLCDFTGTSRTTVIKALKSLVEKEFVIKIENNINGVIFNRYKANLQVVKKLYGGSKETLQGGSKETLQGGSKETLHNNKYINNKDIDNKDIYSEVLGYLNEKAKTNYRISSKEAQKHINARLSEGFTVEDFKTVIDKKCSEWIGTDYEQYLRPQTLFGTKFESYLNAPVRERKTYGANGIEILKPDDDEIAGIF